MTARAISAPEPFMVHDRVANATATEKKMTTIPLLGAYPLEIVLGGRCFNVSGVDEAVRLLEQEWPEKAGVHYAQALRPPGHVEKRLFGGRERAFDCSMSGGGYSACPILGYRKCSAAALSGGESRQQREFGGRALTLRPGTESTRTRWPSHATA